MRDCFAVFVVAALAAVTIGPATALTPTATAPTAAAASPTTKLNWAGYCRPGYDGAFDCGTAKLPRCHDGVCVVPSTPRGDTGTVALEIIRHLTPGAKAVIWWVTETSNFDYDSIATLAAAQQASVYAMKTRNTGDSTIERKCYDKALQSAAGSAAVVAGCALELASAGIPAASVSLTSLATDVVSAIVATQSTEPVFVYARGRATLVLRRLMQLPAAQTLVSGFVFDSLRPPLVSDEDAGADHIADVLLKACVADSKACGTHFKKRDPRDVLREIYTQIDASSDASKCIPIVRDALLKEATDTVPSYAFRALLARLAARNDSALVIPALIYRIQECDDDETSALSSFFRTALWDDPKSVFEKTHVLPDRIVDFSERWPQPAPSQTALQAELDATLMSNGSTYRQLGAYCAFSNDLAAACTGLRSANASAQALTYKRDQYATASTGPGANVLWFASRMNGISPAKSTHEMYQSMATSGVKLAVYSDAIQETELFSRDATNSGRLQRVFSLFISQAAAANPVVGEWHIDQVEQLVANPSSSPDKPVAIGEVSIAYSALDESTAARSFFSKTYLYDKPEDSKAHTGPSTLMIILCIVLGVGVGCPILGCLFSRCAPAEQHVAAPARAYSSAPDTRTSYDYEQEARYNREWQANENAWARRDAFSSGIDPNTPAYDLIGR